MKIIKVTVPKATSTIAHHQKRTDIEMSADEPYVVKPDGQRTKVAAIVFIFLMVFTLMGIGKLLSVYLYKQHLNSVQNHRNCLNDDDNSLSDSFLAWNTFRNQSIDEDLLVPDFSNGRQGGFLHDFYNNLTAIVDFSGSRCFVMPLNQTLVPPPRSFTDIFRNMIQGRYIVDTTLVRREMTVVIPPVEDLVEVGSYIAEKCKNLPIYKLEKHKHHVVKRSAAETPKFTEKLDTLKHEVSINNFDELLAYEESIRK